MLRDNGPLVSFHGKRLTGRHLGGPRSQSRIGSSNAKKLPAYMRRRDDGVVLASRHQATLVHRCCSTGNVLPPTRSPPAPRDGMRDWGTTRARTGWQSRSEDGGPRECSAAG